VRHGLGDSPFGRDSISVAVQAQLFQSKFLPIMVPLATSRDTLGCSEELMSLGSNKVTLFQNIRWVSTGLGLAVSMNSKCSLPSGHPVIRSRPFSMGQREQSKDREAMDRRASLAARVRKI